MTSMLTAADEELRLLNDRNELTSEMLSATEAELARKTAELMAQAASKYEARLSAWEASNDAALRY